VRRTGITDIALVVLGFDPFSAGLLACAGALVCARGLSRLGCQCDNEVGAEGGGEAFEDADGGHGSTGFESGDGGLGHTGSLGELGLGRAELEPAGPHGLAAARECARCPPPQCRSRLTNAVVIGLLAVGSTRRL
jgi:hypothetical protein